MTTKTGNFKQLGCAEMKEIKGGALPPPKTKWRCTVNGVDFDQCYSVQPKTPCNYPSLCTDIGTCESTFDICEVLV